MRKPYVLKKLFVVLIFTTVFPAFAIAASDIEEKSIAEGISESTVQLDLNTREIRYLNHLLASENNREEYVDNLYATQKMENEIVSLGLDKTQPLMEALRNARHKVLLNALLGYHVRQIDEDIRALAKERYNIDPSAYQARKRIKMAFIFVEKESGVEDQAKLEIEGVLTELKEQPEHETLFYTLAEEHSDDKLSIQGGVIKKWLIASAEMEKRSPILQAAFEMEYPGQLSEIIETDKGYAVVKLMKVRPARNLTFKEARPAITETIVGSLQYRKKAEVMASLQPQMELDIDDATLKALVSSMVPQRDRKNEGESELKETENLD